MAKLDDDPEFLEGLMDLDEKLWRSKQEGLEQGLERDRSEGLTEGSGARQRQIAELARRMAADGLRDEFFDVLVDGHKLDAALERYGIRCD